MPDLTIECARATVDRQFAPPLREELEDGGMSFGFLSIGNLAAEPSMVYFLWRNKGDATVSLLIPRDSFKDDTSTREAARTFLARWKQRPGAPPKSRPIG